MQLTIRFVNVRVFGDLDRVSVERGDQGGVRMKLRMSGFEREWEVGQWRELIWTTFSSFAL